MFWRGLPLNHVTAVNQTEMWVTTTDMNNLCSTNRVPCNPQIICAASHANGACDHIVATKNRTRTNNEFKDLSNQTGAQDLPGHSRSCDFPDETRPVGTPQTNSETEESDESIAIEVDSDAISLKSLIQFTKINWPELVNEVVDATLIRQEATARGIRATNNEMQLAADEFRTQRELYDEQTTESWLRSRYLSRHDWESLLEGEIVKEKLKKVLTAGRVEKYFAEHRLTFDSASISRLVVRDEQVARELRAQMVEEHADFHTLTREHSYDLKTKMSGGYQGAIHRSEMQPVLEAAVFGSSVGKIIGPIKTYDGWELVKVESIQLANLDRQLRELIESRLFEEWLVSRRRTAKLRIMI